jgi:hypothetical protein
MPVRIFSFMKKELMNWDVCLKEHVVCVRPNEERVSEIIKMINLRISFWNSHIFEEKYTSLVLEGYYEIIKELLVALLLKEGLSSGNHECLISFLKEKYPSLIYESSVIHRLKGVRNDIAYRGFFAKKEYLEENKEEFDRIISVLKGLV